MLTTNPMLAQTEDRPWFFGIGVNAVDYQHSTPTSLATDYSALRISAGRLLWRQLSAEFSYTQNTFSDHPMDPDVELDHSAIDAMLMYSFRNLIYGEDFGLIDPYLGAGAGITWLESIEEDAEDNIQNNSLNAILGVNFWVGPNLAIYGQGAFKNHNDEFVETYYEYAIGIRYTFGLTSSSVCFP